jgi:Fe-S cluster assembly scaffold protein SufB
VAYADATMEWIDGNLGSRLTMKYPAVYMMEPGARGEILSIAFASAYSANPDIDGKVTAASASVHRLVGKGEQIGFEFTRNGSHEELPIGERPCA